MSIHSFYVVGIRIHCSRLLRRFYLSNTEYRQIWRKSRNIGRKLANVNSIQLLPFSLTDDALLNSIDERCHTFQLFHRLKVQLARANWKFTIDNSHTKCKCVCYLSVRLIFDVNRCKITTFLTFLTFLIT